MKVKIEYPKPNEKITGNDCQVKIKDEGCNNVRVSIDSGSWQQCYFMNNNEGWRYNWKGILAGTHELKAEGWNEQGKRTETTVIVYCGIEPPKEEEKPEKQEITAVKNDFMRAEVNFLQYPIGVLDQHFKGKTFTFKEIIPQDNGIIETSWGILGSDKYGIPGPTAVELDAAITKLISDQYEKEKKYSIWYKASYYELCKIAGKKYYSRGKKIIERDLKKLCTTSYESSFAFKTKGQSPDHPASLISRKYDSIILRGEDIPSSIPKEELTEKERATKKTEHVYIILSPVYLASLQSHYTKPVYYEITKQLHGAVSKRIFQLLSLKFKTKMKQDATGKDYINYNYQEFCGRLPLKVWTIKARVRHQLKKYLKQLVDQGYLEKYIFEFVDNENYPVPPDKWFIRFYPGAFAKYELDYCAGQMFLWDNFLSKQKQLEASSTSLPDMFSQYEQEEKELKEWKSKLDLLPAEEKEELKQQAIKKQQANGQLITNLGTDLEMINIYKQQKGT
ncbi:hypothetical protein KKA69_01755 [Patescibacteria group bacterium]|nr:hypothetical protein [Patescibacteria group bacterium]